MVKPNDLSLNDTVSETPRASKSHQESSTPSQSVHYGVFCTPPLNPAHLISTTVIPELSPPTAKNKRTPSVALTASLQDIQPGASIIISIFTKTIAK